MLWHVKRDSQRHNTVERQSMVSWALSRMEYPEVQALKRSILRADSEKAAGLVQSKLVWPNPFRMHQIFSGMPDQPFGDEVPVAAQDDQYHKQHHNRIRAAKRALEDFMRCARCDPTPSVVPGRMNVWREEKLVRMLKIIELGVVMVDGVERAAADFPEETRPPMYRIFFDIWEARLMSKQFDDDAVALASKAGKPLSNRRIYELLQEREPKLYKGVIGVKMSRDNELVRHRCLVLCKVRCTCFVHRHTCCSN